jgi:cytidylate kinase
MAAGATLIDSSALTIQEVIDHVLGVVAHSG